MTFFLNDQSTAVIKGPVQIATFPPYADGRFIERASLVGPGTCKVYVGAINATFQQDTTTGNSSKECANGLFVPSGTSVFFVWDDVTSEANVSVRWAKA